jgi:hypothetical protein
MAVQHKAWNVTFLNAVAKSSAGDDLSFKELREKAYPEIRGLDGTSVLIALADRPYARDSIPRTLAGIGQWLDKHNWRRGINSEVASAIENLVNCEISTQDEYDYWHHIACNRILKVSEAFSPPFKELVSLPYGAVQKWLNMAIKYAYTTEIWFEQFASLERFLHVAVDDYIITAARREEGVKSPGSWSRLNYSDYQKFQDDLRERLVSKGSLPFVWEFDAWLREKKSREE